MSQFEKYRDALRDTKSFSAAHTEVRWQAEQLVLYQCDLRSKSLQFAETTRPREDGRSHWVHDTLQEFVTDIREYLIVNSFNIGRPGPNACYNNQRWATAILASLDEVARNPELNEEEMRYRAIAHVDSAVAEMQFMYAKVSASFFSLKAYLVK